MRKIIIIIAASIVFLELLSGRVKCPARKEPDQIFLNQMSIDQEKQKVLSDLKQRRQAGQKISKKDYQAGFEKLVLEVEPERLGYFYGLAFPNGRAFVRNNLPSQIKEVVKRHELEHLLQTGMEFNKEFMANIATVKEYPWGGFQMILFVIRDKFRSTDSILCFIVNLWVTFKHYLLPL